ncbi:hypothetical protein SAMN04488570_0175 [Nocardioides scoriae]|uniref:Uncharacterized protein n=1 Tax=Nocardioides scoriae TaxID=642780 RepID=A0A1H1LDY3_9ACTN|nr:hypothetical protein [Nocardioides scoriae]SDR72738.1 hypothetical protein SAMN04488570_0175 [Nocardioides scoriae]
MISTVIALPYEIARLPLVAVDNRLVGRLAEDSFARVGLDRTIGSADRIAGTLLRNRAIAERGTERLERSEKLQAAVQLEEEAATRREQAAKKAAAGRKQAARKRKQAQERAEQGLKEADEAEARGKAKAKADAAKLEAAKKAEAEKRADDKAAAAEKRQQAADAEAKAKKDAAQREAKKELDDARATKKAADDARADAARLGELTEAKKQERQQAQQDGSGTAK